MLCFAQCVRVSDMVRAKARSAAAGSEATAWRALLTRELHQLLTTMSSHAGLSERQQKNAAVIMQQREPVACLH